MTNPYEPNLYLGDLLKACLQPGFWTRVGIYSGLTLSLLIAAQQQFLIAKSKYRWTRTNQVTGEAVMQQALRQVQQFHGQTGTLPTSIDVGNEPPDVWTTSAPEAGGEGPRQTINGQMFPPRQESGIVITYQEGQQYFIGVAFVGNDTRLRTLACQGDRPFEPTEFSVVDLRQGRQSLTCPPSGAPLRLP